MIYQLLYKVYFGIKFDTSHFLSRLYLRFFNFIIPIYFDSMFSEKPRIVNNSCLNRGIIVSLTTFPERIDTVHLVIESIMRQTVTPDSIILWLSKLDFPDGYIMPSSLQKLEKRGLAIRWVDENLKSHKKYYYTFLEYPDARIITIDDDEFYPDTLIANFLQTSKNYPESIIATRARKIRYENGKIASYKTFENIVGFHKPDTDLLAIGCGGVFYPTGSLSIEVFDKKNIFDLALLCDDLWIKFANKKNTQVVCISNIYNNKSFLPLYMTRNTPKLMDTNIYNENNDRVISNLSSF